MGRPFDDKERREPIGFTVSQSARIAARNKPGGQPPAVAARHERTEKYAGVEMRHYTLDGLPTTYEVQLNGGDPADDEARIAGEAATLLSDCETPEDAG